MKRLQRLLRPCAAIAAVLSLIALAGALSAASAEVRLSRGQTVYVPAYSHVYLGDRQLAFNLGTTLSIRNTDPAHSITVTQADYYDENGKLVRKYFATPHKLGPLATKSIYVKESDTAGGFGASFIVKWHADREVNTPIVECVGIGARSGQGISFVSPGQVIHEAGK